MVRNLGTENMSFGPYPFFVRAKCVSDRTRNSHPSPAGRRLNYTISMLFSGAGRQPISESCPPEKILEDLGLGVGVVSEQGEFKDFFDFLK